MHHSLGKLFRPRPPGNFENKRFAPSCLPCQSYKISAGSAILTLLIIKTLLFTFLIFHIPLSRIAPMNSIILILSCYFEYVIKMIYVYLNGYSFCEQLLKQVIL
ncbi:MAG: hypothetical protein B1H11_09150 [Desulfobacteraceae bacterium 4484_190.1]|nr:MAG: hypothetical protein B1H11_09150 [Desulfobacteraceae bacterium 4484_190.1]